MRVVVDYVVGAGGALIGSAVTLEKLTNVVDLVGSGLGLVLVVLSIGLVAHRWRLTKLELGQARRTEQENAARDRLSGD